ncbi:MAG: hypothetical protein ACRD8O_03610, partial [Bryobacteraceae bacterium]
MSAAILLLAALVLPVRAAAEGLRGATQSYSADSITNSASNRSGSLAPNTLASVYGADLAYVTRAVTADDIVAGGLPAALGGVNVFVGGLRAHLLYVSPQQVNFLVPYSLLAGQVDFRVDRDGTRGPTVRLTLAETAPALFQLDPETALAAHADGSVVTREAPAQPDEVIVLYATGLGRTSPDPIAGQLATYAAGLV